MYPKYILKAITNNDVMFKEHVEVVSMLAIIFAPSFHVSKRRIAIVVGMKLHRIFKPCILITVKPEIQSTFTQPYIIDNNIKIVHTHAALQFTIEAATC